MVVNGLRPAIIETDVPSYCGSFKAAESDFGCQDWSPIVDKWSCCSIHVILAILAVFHRSM